MSELDGFFKFKIGDTVRLKSHLNGYLSRNEKFVPQVLSIVERHLHQCYGGIQAFYLCRAHDAQVRGGFDGVIQQHFVTQLCALTEIELVHYELPLTTVTQPEKSA